MLGAEGTAIPPAVVLGTAGVGADGAGTEVEGAEGDAPADGVLPESPVVGRVGRTVPGCRGAP
ncbi:MAG: hypothetical protein AAFR84_17460, partial [Pseudomonadota bacterium]